VVGPVKYGFLGRLHTNGALSVIYKCLHTVDVQRDDVDVSLLPAITFQHVRRTGPSGVLPKSGGGFPPSA
jgi:hypothetical protein